MTENVEVTHITYCSPVDVYQLCRAMWRGAEQVRVVMEVNCVGIMSNLYLRPEESRNLLRAATRQSSQLTQHYVSQVDNLF